MFYHKIDTLFERDENFKVNVNKVRRPEFDLIKEWYIEEKIDGMSVGFRYYRDSLYDDGIIFGRTGNTNWNANNRVFMDRQSKDMHQSATEILQDYDLEHLTIYGELYGPGIQNGGSYRDDLGFICFDMTANDTWLNVKDRNTNAERIGVDVPYHFKLFSDIDSVARRLANNTQASPQAKLNGKPERMAEGVIGRPPVNLYDQRGNRVMWKLKGRDF